MYRWNVLRPRLKLPTSPDFSHGFADSGIVDVKSVDDGTCFNPKVSTSSAGFEVMFAQRYPRCNLTVTYNFIYASANILEQPTTNAVVYCAIRTILPSSARYAQVDQPDTRGRFSGLLCLCQPPRPRDELPTGSMGAAHGQATGKDVCVWPVILQRVKLRTIRLEACKLIDCL
jgi:hypothetical protein